MGKIVKYCSSCDEGFAERFGFCPDCGAPLQAFELNPVTGQMGAGAEDPPAPEFISEPAVEPMAEAAPSIVETPVIEPEPEYVTEPDVDLEYDDARVDNSYSWAAPASAYANAPVIDDGYHITVIEEQNVAQRNGLLLGASVFMILFVLTLTVYSLFTKTLGVNAIDDGMSLALLIDEVPPMDTEELEEKKKDDKGGGGGGSGSEEETPASKGDLADQSKTPTRPPNVNTMRSDTPMLQTPTTEGTMKFPKVHNKWGLPNGLDGLSSNGPGTGGGIGSGSGTGQGSGTGSGAGSGSGSGYGSGEGDGIGSGRGGGTGGPPDIVRVTSPFRIISKPKATYTDAARTNNVQGSVRLRIVLLASGQVGSITPVTRLPYGLTEQAIAAARQIRFEPKKVNGVPVSATVTFEYGFNIY